MAVSAKKTVVVRKSQRTALPQYSSEKEGRFLERVVPDSERKIDVYAGAIQPGGGGGNPEPYSHEGEEFCFVLGGRLEFTVGGQRHSLEPGDLIYFPSTVPHSYKNTGSEVATVIWGEPMIGDPPT